jgi:hypothetical protein
MSEYIELQAEEDAEFDWHNPWPRWPPQVESPVACALPDLRYVIYAGVVAAGALFATVWLVRKVFGGSP